MSPRAFDLQLAQAGSDYYLTARFAMKAQRFVSGNLFHHAVEMFLKSGLAKKGHTEPELKALGHRLGKIWHAFKTNYGDNAGLVRHDLTVSALDKFEEIRYPPADLSFVVRLQWDEPTALPLSANMELYTLVVREIDALVADILATAGWNPSLLFWGNNLTMLDALTFRNEQGAYLLRKEVE